MKGSNNQLFLNHSFLHRCHITVTGNNNVVRFEKGTSINGMNIIVEGNDCKVFIGEQTTCNGASIVCMGESTFVTLGCDCMLASGIKIWNTDSHQIVNDKGHIVNPSRSIAIGNHVWIGEDAKILKGVSVGDNAVIGMGSVVCKDVPDGTVNVGVPARAVKSNISWKRERV